MLCRVNGIGQDDVNYGNVASIKEVRPISRIRPIHLGVDYNEEPLSFNITFASTRDKMFDRYEIEEITYWLTGHQDYQWLTINQFDMQNFMYRCLITNLKPTSVNGAPIAFNATVRCDCPYAYSYPYSYSYTINGATEIVFNNKSTVHEYIKPVIEFTPASGTTSLSIVNNSDNGRTTNIGNIPSSTIVRIDNENGIIQAFNSSTNQLKNDNLYTNFNFKFFRLIPKENVLQVNGNGSLTISGRFLHNIGA